MAERPIALPPISAGEWRLDLASQLQHLAEAEARGSKHIFDQEMRIADFEVRGHVTILAPTILETFRRTQAQHNASRSRPQGVRSVRSPQLARCLGVDRETAGRGLDHRALEA